MHPCKPRLPFANAWFFPAAALYAALLLPWSVLTMLGLASVLPGLATPAGHAHEMLFGFALAVIAGYLLGPQPLRLTLALLGCWLLATGAPRLPALAGVLADTGERRAFSAPRRNGATRSSPRSSPA